MMSLSNTIILYAPLSGAAGYPAERERARLAFLSKYRAAIAGRRTGADKHRAQPAPEPARAEPDRPPNFAIVTE